MTDYDKGYFDAGNDQVDQSNEDDDYFNGVQAWFEEASERNYDFEEDYVPPLVGAPDY